MSELTQTPVVIQHPPAERITLHATGVAVFVLTGWVLSHTITGLDEKLAALAAFMIGGGVSAALNAFGIWITYSLGPIVSLSLYVLALGVFGYGMLHPAVEKNLAIKLGLARDQ